MEVLLEKCVLLTESEGGCIFLEEDYLFFRKGVVEWSGYSSLEKVLLTMAGAQSVVLRSLNLSFRGIEITSLFIYRLETNRVYLLINGSYDENTAEILSKLIETNELVNCNCYQILNCLRDAIVTTNAKGVIQYVNPATIEMFGYSYSELLNQSIDILMPKTFPGRTHEKFLERYLDSEDKPRIDLPRRLSGKKKDGVVFPIEISVIEQHNEMFTGIIRDMTDSESYKEIKRLNLSKKTFISSMGHEIRTPLNGIIGMTQLIRQEEDLTPSTREAVEIINECGVQLVNLVNDILDYSKITSGCLKFDRVHFNLRECVKRCIFCFALQAQEKGLNLNFNCQEDISEYVYGDPKRIRQVIFNLLSNAIKFTPKGSILVNIVRDNNKDQHSSCHQPGTRLLIQVTDTGIGIATDRQEEIFEAFNQITDSYTCETTSSTGLGLAISRNLSQLMGGSLTVKSQLGIGSTFEFIFQTEEIDHLEDPSKIEIKKLEQIKKAKILVVDDQVNNRIIIDKMLAPYCDNLKILSSSNEVIKAVKEDDFDIIFMDIIMPGINGIELIDLIRENCNGKIVAISSVSDTFDFSNKFDHVMVKPLNRDMMLKTIEQCLDFNQLKPFPSINFEHFMASTKDFVNYLNVQTNDHKQETTKTPNTVKEVSETVEEAAEKIEDKVEGAAEKIEDKVEGAAEKVEDKSERIEEESEKVGDNSETGPSQKEQTAQSAKIDSDTTELKGEESNLESQSGSHLVSSIHSTSTSPSTSINILIVEDNPNNCTVIKLLLERLGYKKITIANNGAKAVKLALKNDYDVILMDLKLPIMDGVTASEQILKSKPHSYIIIVSACILEEDKQRCRNSGINNYLPKPINISLLKNMLMRTTP